MTYAFTNEDVIDAQAGNREAFNKILTGLQPMIGGAVKRYGEPHLAEDLHQAAQAAVWEAVQGWSGGTVSAFMVFAKQCVKSAVLEDRATWVAGPSVPYRTTAKVLAALKKANGSVEDAREIALTGTGVTAETFNAVTAAMGVTVEPLPCEEVIPEAVDDSRFTDAEDRILVAELLATLSDREREALVLAFGLEDGIERNDGEVAAVMGIDRTRACRIKNRALMKLRQEAV